MSNKIKQSLSQQPKEYELSNYEFDFLNAANNLTQATIKIAQGTRLLSSQYLKVLATEKLGYAPEENLEFEVDLTDESHLLKIKVLPRS